MRVVGLCGLIGVGKTTVAKHLCDDHGYTRVRFAGPLKEMGRVLLSERQIDGDLKETPSDMLGGKTPRQFMQFLGTEFGREMIDADLWVNAWRARAMQHELVVADDVRFPNEAEVIDSLDGILINIERPGILRQEHASEGQDLDWDYSVNNDGDIPTLMREVLSLL
jgi:predicted kinase